MERKQMTIRVIILLLKVNMLLSNNIYDINCSSIHPASANYPFAEVYVHNGYKEILSVSTKNLIDLAIFPYKYSNHWYVVTLELTPSAVSDLVLYEYSFQGTNFKEFCRVPIYGGKKITPYWTEKKYYVIITEGVLSNTMSVYFVNPVTEKLDIMYTSPNKMTDVVMWSNPATNNQYMMIARDLDITPHSEITVYQLNQKNQSFVTVHVLSVKGNVKMTAFEMNRTSFIALTYSNHRKPSEILIQNKTTGILYPYQKLSTYFAVGVTHICFNNEEHFLLVTSNYQQNPTVDTNDLQYQPYSIVYKWDDDYFAPFQSLDISSRNAFLTSKGRNGEITLLNWDLNEGIVAYQYDGWRFMRSNVTLHSTNYDQFEEMHDFNFRNASIFSVMWNGNGTRNLKLFSPTYKLNTELSDIYWDILKWSCETSVEIKIAMSLPNKIKAIQKIKKLNFNLNGTLNLRSSGDKIHPTYVTNVIGTIITKNATSENDRFFKSMYQPSGNMFQLSKSMLLNDVNTIEELEASDISAKSRFRHHSRLRYHVDIHHVAMHSNKELWLKSYKRITKDLKGSLVVLDTYSHGSNPTKSHSFINDKTSSKEILGHQITLTNMFLNVKGLSPIIYGTLNHLYIAVIDYNNAILVYSWDPKSNEFHLNKGSARLQKGINMTAFSSIKLGENSGIYVEGIQNDKIIGQVYKLNTKENLQLVYKLPIKNRSTVKGVQLHNSTQCFIIVTKEGNSCLFYCPYSLPGHIPCENVTEVYVVGMKEDADIILISPDKIDVWNLTSYTVDLVQTIHTENPIDSSIAYENTRRYIVVMTAEHIYIYRKTKRFYTQWKQIMRNGLGYVNIGLISPGKSVIYFESTRKENHTVQSNFLYNQTNFIISKDRNNYIISSMKFRK